MAKVGFASLGCKLDTSVKTIEINGREIEVKQYLPANDKISLIGIIVNAILNDGEKYVNQLKVDIFTKIEILEFYTNITFTDKQQEDLPKVFDILESNGIFEAIIEAIPADEYKSLTKGINQSVEALDRYRSSVLGVLEMINQDYAEKDLEATTIQEKLADPENLKLLKDVLTKLG